MYICIPKLQVHLYICIHVLNHHYHCPQAVFDLFRLRPSYLLALPSVAYRMMAVFESLELRRNVFEKLKFEDLLGLRTCSRKHHAKFEEDGSPAAKFLQVRVLQHRCMQACPRPRNQWDELRPACDSPLCSATTGVYMPQRRDNLIPCVIMLSTRRPAFTLDCA